MALSQINQSFEAKKKVSHGLWLMEDSWRSFQLKWTVLSHSDVSAFLRDFTLIAVSTIIAVKRINYEA